MNVRFDVRTAARKAWPRFVPVDEQSFAAANAWDTRTRSRAVCAIGGAGWLVYIALSTLGRVGPVNPLAAVVATVLFVAQLAAVAGPAGSWRYQQGVPLTWLGLGLVTAITALRPSDSRFAVPVEVLLVALLAVYFGSGVGFRRSTVSCLAVTAVWVLGIVILGLRRPMFVYEVQLLVTANAVGIFGSFLFEAEARKAHALEQELAALAETDPLTGLLDRRAFRARLDKLWAVAATEGRPVALALVDVDEFKAVNDAHGHSAGDRCLQIVAEQLRAHQRRPLDLACRLGGDEFAAVWYDPDETWLEATLTGLLAAVAASTADVPGFTISIGAAFAEADDQADDLLARADANLLGVKRQGRDGVLLSAPGVVP